MTESNAETAETVSAPEPADAPRGSRRAVVRFLVGFVVLVMALLIGYRYAMDTGPNIWYLFQVAKHTAWALDVVGTSGEVEPLHGTSPRKWRTDLAEWSAERKGEAEVSAPATTDPITAWEAWQWKAWSRIRDGESIAEDGPIVRFVLEEGIGSRQAALRREIDGARRAPKTGAPADTAKLQTELEALTAKLSAMPAGPERNRASRGRQFSFHVVPDCGAIPSMSIFLAAVLAFPALWWKRLAGAVCGIAVLYGVNIVRLATLGYIGAIDQTPDRKWFTFAHEYVWQGVFIVFVVAVWMMWIEWFVRPRRA